MNAERLLALYDRVADAPDAIPRLRRFVLDLAVRGKLVPQDPADEPASELLKNTKPATRAALALPATWAVVELRRIMDFKYGKGLKATARLDEGSILVFGFNGVVGYTSMPLTE